MFEKKVSLLVKIQLDLITLAQSTKAIRVEDVFYKFAIWYSALEECGIAELPPAEAIGRSALLDFSNLLDLNYALNQDDN